MPNGRLLSEYHVHLRKTAGFLNRHFAMLVLLSYVAIHGVYHKVPQDSNSPSWSGENQNIAASIVQGKGFANPFPPLETGPSAWVAPTFPYFLAGIFWLVGTKTLAAARLSIVLQSLLFAGTLWLLYSIVQSAFSTVTAKLATLIWLFSPNRIGLTSTYFLSEVGFSTFSFVLAIFAVNRFRDNSTTKTATFAGLAMGFAILCLPVMVLALPLYAYAFYVLAKARPALARAAPMLVRAISIAVLAPWLVRNYVVFRKVVFIKSNLGVALYLANSGENREIGYYNYASEAEGEVLQRMGEIAYNRYSLHRAMEWIRGHKKEFLVRCVKRGLAFWVANPATDFKRWIWNHYQIPLLVISALGVCRHWRRSPVTVFCLAMLIVVPGVYYLTSLVDQQRYRLPFEALLTIFASTAMSALEPGHNDAGRTPLGVGLKT